MSKRKKPQPLGFHLKAGACLVLLSIPLITIALARHAGADAWADLAEPGAVKLWKADKQLAALTPGCDVYDYTCVIAASK